MNFFRSESSLHLTSPQEFFYQCVSSTVQKQNIKIEPNIEYYLVNLLCDFVEQDKIKNRCQDFDLFDTPLAFFLEKEREASTSERIKILKGMGDLTLYISGYFQDYFNRRSVGLNYYIDMGSQAYSRLSTIIRDQDDNFSRIYAELAQNFPLLVDVVADISESLSPTKETKDILFIYERWQNNHSDRLRKKLEEKGISPIPSSKNKQ
ncbi:MAG: hypothetical protein KA436_03685 [Oligoflexales bacterium]|nr:hypothetical protein [Oligoflexales bacterium]